MKIAIHYFSGCGNTAWVALQVEKTLQAAGHEIVLKQNAELAFPAMMPQTDIDLFLSPVYFGGLPSNVVSYYKRLPLVANRKAIFVGVCGAKVGIADWLATSCLKERGYDVIATDAVIMPDTFLFLKMSQLTPEERMSVLSKAKEKIAQLPDVLTSLPVVKKKNPFVLVSLGMFYFVYLFVIRHCLGLMMTANSKCTHCGQCVENCPEHCIQMKNEKPTWKINCANCFRCLNNCPVQAIDFSKYAFYFCFSGAVIGMIVLRILIPLGVLSYFAGLLIGSFVGCFLYQKIRPARCEKGLFLENRKRVLITEEEKNL